MDALGPDPGSGKQDPAFDLVDDAPAVGAGPHQRAARIRVPILVGPLVHELGFGASARVQAPGPQQPVVPAPGGRHGQVVVTPQHAVHPKLGLPQGLEVAVERSRELADPIALVRLGRRIPAVQRLDGVQRRGLVGAPGDRALAGADRAASDGDVVGQREVFDLDDLAGVLEGKHLHLRREAAGGDVVAPGAVQRADHQPLAVRRRRRLVDDVRVAELGDRPVQPDPDQLALQVVLEQRLVVGTGQQVAVRPSRGGPTEALVDDRTRRHRARLGGSAAVGRHALADQPGISRQPVARRAVRRVQDRVGQALHLARRNRGVPQLDAVRLGQRERETRALHVPSDVSDPGTLGQLQLDPLGLLRRTHVAQHDASVGVLPRRTVGVGVDGDPGDLHLGFGQLGQRPQIRAFELQHPLTVGRHRHSGRAVGVENRLNVRRWLLVGQVACEGAQEEGQNHGGTPAPGPITLGGNPQAAWGNSPIRRPIEGCAALLGWPGPCRTNERVAPPVTAVPGRARGGPVVHPRRRGCLCVRPGLRPPDGRADPRWVARHRAVRRARPRRVRFYNLPSAIHPALTGEALRYDPALHRGETDWNVFPSSWWPMENGTGSPSAGSKPDRAVSGGEVRHCCSTQGETQVVEAVEHWYYDELQLPARAAPRHSTCTTLGRSPRARDRVGAHPARRVPDGPCTPTVGGVTATAGQPMRRQEQSRPTGAEHLGEAGRGWRCRRSAPNPSAPTASEVPEGRPRSV